MRFFLIFYFNGGITHFFLSPILKGVLCKGELSAFFFIHHFKGGTVRIFSFFCTRHFKGGITRLFHFIYFVIPHFKGGIMRPFIPHF